MIRVYHPDLLFLGSSRWGSFSLLQMLKEDCDANDDEHGR